MPHLGMLSQQLEKMLARNALFSDLGERERRTLARLVRPTYAKPRKVICWEGETGSSLFVVLNGHLKVVTCGPDGKEVLLSVMGAGEFFGEIAILDGKPRSASVVALENVTLGVIERDSLLEVLESSPRLAICLIRVLVARLRHLSKRCESISSMDVCSRLARVIVDLAEKHGELGTGELLIPIALSQLELGNMVGASRESVNKLLRHWGEQGLVRHHRDRIAVQNLDALKGLLID